MANTGLTKEVTTFDTTAGAELSGQVTVHLITLTASSAAQAVIEDSDEGYIVAELRCPANGSDTREFCGGYTFLNGLKLTTLTAAVGARVCVYK